VSYLIYLFCNNIINSAPAGFYICKSMPVDNENSRDAVSRCGGGSSSAVENCRKLEDYCAMD
jgi:hypothetical protein